MERIDAVVRRARQLVVFRRGKRLLEPFDGFGRVPAGVLASATFEQVAHANARRLGVECALNLVERFVGIVEMALQSFGACDLRGRFQGLAGLRRMATRFLRKACLRDVRVIEIPKRVESLGLISIRVVHGGLCKGGCHEDGDARRRAKLEQTRAANSQQHADLEG